MISDSSKITEYYKALVKRDPAYVGVFYVGVNTTGIFCISTCRARKPKPENVSFYNSSTEAIKSGFRPCKICKPTENSASTPENIRNLLDMINSNPENRITDADLRDLGNSPEKIRRWFRSNYGITFQAYHRMIRINSAYQKLKEGNNITATAYDVGYESLSGFGYGFKQQFESSPENVNDINLIYWHQITTPLGPMHVCATEKGICLLEFTDRKMLETELKDLTKRLNAKLIAGKHKFIIDVENQLDEYFSGNRIDFTVPLHTPGTDFQQSVWKQLMTIPYGTTRSYKEQAIVLKKPQSVRAVARANGLNRVAIIIPCHRVIGSNGDLIGYGGGLPRKKWLLEHERNSVALTV